MLLLVRALAFKRILFRNPMTRPSTWPAEQSVEIAWESFEFQKVPLWKIM